MVLEVLKILTLLSFTNKGILVDRILKKYEIINLWIWLFYVCTKVATGSFRIYKFMNVACGFE